MRWGVAMSSKEKHSIPEALLVAAREHGKFRSDEITARWLNAKKTIEEEISGNDNLYPHNRGRLNVKEVCRRAEISQQTLYAKVGPHRTTTLVEIKDWCESKASRTVPEIRKTTMDGIQFWKAELHKVATQIHKYELDLAEKDRAFHELQEENKKLRALLQPGIKKNVHALHLKK
jgi:hypothetical protein